MPCSLPSWGSAWLPSWQRMKAGTDDARLCQGCSGSAVADSVGHSCEDVESHPPAARPTGESQESQASREGGFWPSNAPEQKALGSSLGARGVVSVKATCVQAQCVQTSGLAPQRVCADPVINHTSQVIHHESEIGSQGPVMARLLSRAV